MSIREEMTISRYGRGTCPVCDRSIRILKNGTIGRHGEKGAWPPADCPGYGQKPKED